MNPTDPLSELRGIALPEPSLFDWWPLSIAWWALIILLLVVVYFLARFVKKLRADNWYKQAKKELQAIRLLGDQNEQAVLTRSSALCRRVAMAIDGREAVARLTGTEWFAKLDQLSGGHEFTKRHGAVLDNSLWKKNTVTSEQEQREVLEALSQLIENNKPGFRATGRVK